jgi:hypothetical protein
VTGPRAKCDVRCAMCDVPCATWSLHCPGKAGYDMCHEPSAMCHGCFVVALPSLGRIRFNTDEARCRGTMSPTWSGQGECSYEGEWRMSRKASRSAWSSKLSLLGWRRLSRWVRFARRCISSSLSLESDSPDHYQPSQPHHTPTQPNPILSDSVQPYPTPARHDAMHRSESSKYCWGLSL